MDSIVNYLWCIKGITMIIIAYLCIFGKEVSVEFTYSSALILLIFTTMDI